MTDKAVQQALENIYTSLINDNEEIDQRIDDLKAALGTEKSVTVDPTRLAENTRPGRRHMQAYFKKRGVVVNFSDKK